MLIIRKAIKGIGKINEFCYKTIRMKEEKQQLSIYRRLEKENNNWDEIFTDSLFK